MVNLHLQNSYLNYVTVCAVNEPNIVVNRCGLLHYWCDALFTNY